MTSKFQQAEREARRSFTENNEPSMTKQADAQAADVNYIVGQYIKNRDPFALMVNQGEFADVSSIGDYLSCVNTVRQAEAAFAQLPAKVRDHFSNDPGNMMEAIFDPTRTAELLELGVLEQTAAPTPTPTTPTPPATPPAPPATPNP